MLGNFAPTTRSSISSGLNYNQNDKRALATERLVHQGSSAFSNNNSMFTSAALTRDKNTIEDLMKQAELENTDTQQYIDKWYQE